MSTAAAPALETAGGSDTPAIDPIDALDLSTIGEDVELSSDAELPESMVVGGKPKEAAEPVQEGRERTPDGKFAKKDGEPAPEGEQQPEDVKPLPFRYRATGKTHDVEGALLDATGNLTVPAAKVPEIREALNALHLVRGEYGPAIQRYKGEVATLQQQLKQATEGRSASEAQAAQIVEFFDAAMAEPDDEKALGALWSLRRQWDTLKANAERDHYKQLAERAKAPAASAPNEAPRTDAAPTIPPADAARATAVEYIESWKIDPEYRDITPDAWKQVEADVAARPFAFLRQATADDAKTHGIPEGQIVFDTDLLHAAIESHRKTTAAQRETARKAAELAASNARRTQPSVNAPPTPGGGRAPANKPKTPQTKEELEDWFNSDSLD